MNQDTALKVVGIFTVLILLEVILMFPVEQQICSNETAYWAQHTSLGTIRYWHSLDGPLETTAIQLEQGLLARQYDLVMETHDFINNLSVIHFSNTTDCIIETINTTAPIIDLFSPNDCVVSIHPWWLSQANKQIKVLDTSSCTIRTNLSPENKD